MLAAARRQFNLDLNQWTPVKHGQIGMMGWSVNRVRRLNDGGLVLCWTMVTCVARQQRIWSKRFKENTLRG